jgi:hypothetical protein
MILSIEDQSVHALATKLARDNGKTVTDVVHEALMLYQDHQEQLSRAKVIAELRGSAKAGANPHFKDNDFLYDPIYGLPQ